MEPLELGKKYDKIAQWWHEKHRESSYGVKQLEQALCFASPGRKALDVGCGSGGRFIRILESNGFFVTGLDASEEMVVLASGNHPGHIFLHQDICSWESEDKFDFVIAWDSIFHLPLAMHKPVVNKLCSLLAKDGVLLYTFGNDYGEHTSQWHNDSFYYSSIGINENMQLLLNNGISILHLELDQYPEKHAYVVARKP